MNGAAQERVINGLCPQCGAEAAPYRLCYKCRMNIRLNRALKRGGDLGVFKTTGEGRGKMWMLGDRAAEDCPDFNKWGTPLHADPEQDRRFAPRVQKIRVDVEKTLVSVIKHIGRPCTTEEIVAAWGRLRAKRSAPLAGDLARIIAAEDKRRRKASASQGPCQADPNRSEEKCP